MSKIFAFAILLVLAPLTALANGHGGWHGGWQRGSWRGGTWQTGRAWSGGYAPHAIWHGGARWSGGFYGARIFVGPGFYGYYAAPPVYYVPYYAPAPVYYPSYAPVVVEQRVYEAPVRPAPQRVTPYDRKPPPVYTPAPQSESSSQREGGTMSAPAKADRN